MPRPRSLRAAGGASRYPALPYTPDSESLLNAAVSSGGLTLRRLRPLATERGPSIRSALHFLIKAKHERGVTGPDCEGNCCAKHVRKRSKTVWSHFRSKTHSKLDTLASPNCEAASLLECVHFLARS